MTIIGKVRFLIITNGLLLKLGNFCLLLFLSCSFSRAQDMIYTHYLVDTLTASGLHGRGYVNNGDLLAAQLIAGEFRNSGMDSFSPGYLQPFEFPVNTFPGRMKLMINERELVPGADYITDPSSGSAFGSYRIAEINGPPIPGKKIKVKNRFVVFDPGRALRKGEKDSILTWLKPEFGASGIIFIAEKKLTWSVSGQQFPFPVIHILKTSMPAISKNIKIETDAVMKEHHTTQNVIGFIKGAIQPDSFLVFSAHYDHLGRMGQQTYFPGANDNASGTAMMLNLVKYYSQPIHKPACSMVFMAFAGEEAGLLGSRFYTENSFFPLGKIKFLINMDLLGTGDEGMMVVNGDVFKPEFELLTRLNDSLHSLKTIGKRGKAMNSDHYYFSEKGVPSFFFYTLGGISSYHDIYDIAATLPLTRFEDVFKLITAFVNELSINKQRN